jgi:cytochrome b6-f complex iron-sulfur subunit
MTSKKKNQAKKTEPTEPVITRRRFLWKLWLTLGAVALLEYLLMVVDFLRPRRRATPAEGGDIIVAGPIDRFERNTVTAFPEGKFYLARLDNGGFLALSRECTHLGCTVPWDSQQKRFICPCHASAYDLTGAVLNPPAPRALNMFPIRIENRIVKVDISQPVKRNSFDSSQVTLV